MWQTPVGPRVLQGAEAQLFRVAAGIYQTILLDMVRDGHDLRGTPPSETTDRWEALGWHQQICAIGEVAQHLLDYMEEDEPPPLFAWSEITLYQIYNFLIDSEDIESFGEFVSQAAVEVGFLKQDKQLKKTEFTDLVGRLMGRVLSDRDFSEAEVEQVRQKGLKALGLREDYWGALFPAFTMERFMASLAVLNEDRASSASALLPRCSLSRFEHGRDEPVEVPDDLSWHPY